MESIIPVGDVMLNELDHLQMIDTARQLHGDLSYHNFGHPLESHDTALDIADEVEQGTGQPVNRKVLKAMALFHDAGLNVFNAGRFKSGEEYAAYIASHVLPFFNYDSDEILLTEQGIRSTEVGIMPLSIEAKIMRRADLNNLKDLNTLLVGTYDVMQEVCQLNGNFPSHDEIKTFKAKTLKLLNAYLVDDEPLFPEDVDHTTGHSKYKMNVRQALVELEALTVNELRLRLKYTHDKREAESAKRPTAA